MYVSRHNNIEYCFYDDHVTVDGVPLRYSEMVDITHKGGKEPSVVFTYGDRRITLPYNVDDRDNVLPYFIRANKIKPEFVIQPVEKVDVAPAEEEYVEAPSAEEYVEAPAADEYVEAPAAEEYYETPAAAEEYVEAPAAEEYAEAPATEEYVEAPAAEGESFEQVINDIEMTVGAASETSGYAEGSVDTPAADEYVEAPAAEGESFEQVINDIEMTVGADPEAAGYAKGDVETLAVTYEPPVEPEAVGYAEGSVEAPAAADVSPFEPETAEQEAAVAKKSLPIAGIIDKFKAMPPKKLIIIAAIAAAVLIAIILFVILGAGKHVDGINGSIKLKTVTTETGDEYKVTTINDDVEVEEFALDYYETCFDDGDKVHWIINKKTNETFMISDNDDTLVICTFDHVEGEEDDPNKLGLGPLRNTWIGYPATGEVVQL